MNREISKSNRTQSIHGYTNGILRVDLTKGDTTVQPLDEVFLRKYLGGAALGIKLTLV